MVNQLIDDLWNQKTELTLIVQETKRVFADRMVNVDRHRAIPQTTGNNLRQAKRMAELAINLNQKAVKIVDGINKLNTDFKTDKKAEL